MIASAPVNILVFWQAYFVLTATGSENSGFIFIGPKTFLAGYESNLCITFKEPNKVNQIEVKILEQKKDIELASAVVKLMEVDQAGKCFRMLLPKTKITNGRLQLSIRSKTDEDFSINYVEQISIKTNPDVTFIQTDKPIYNGGQLLRFRIFTLKPDFTPVLKPIPKIWIENPNGVHVAQWLNERNHKGFISKIFQLSNEPMPGKWYIKIKTVNDEPVSQSFLVENYILPKFSVVIRTPKQFDTVENITVCARYFFGEPVHGDVLLQHFVKCSFSYYCQEKESSVIKTLRLGNDGCLTHVINLTNPSSFAKSLVVNASVFEDDTRTNAKAFAIVPIQNSKRRFTLDFSLETRKKKIKPGLPFKGEVVLNSQALAKVEAIVCVVSNEIKSCRELPLQENKGEFLILPIPIMNEKSFNVSIDAKITGDNESRETFAAKFIPVPWYSPSGSYIQLESLSSLPLRCGQRAKFKIVYTSEKEVIFHYLLKHRGNILQKGTLEKFSIHSKPYEIENNANIINNGDITRVKQFEFSINISFGMSPHSRLLVYYMAYSGEIIADTIFLPVEKCMPNQVNTKWANNIISPGSINSLKIETSANSFCALGISDKSVHLLSSAANLNKDSIFKGFETFEIQPDSLLSTHGNRCKDSKDIKRMITTPKMEYLLERKQTDSPFVDSFLAFSDFGALVITDLHLETRPCRENSMENVSTTRNANISINEPEMENISIFDHSKFVDIDDEPSLKKLSLDYNLRSYFPETWIWDLIQINDSGRTILNFQTPHSLTEWVAETICFSPDTGLGIADHSKLITYQSFFLDFFVPQYLRRKEIFHLEVAVFNYESTELPVKITYISSVSFISKSEEFKSYCLQPRSKVVHRFILEAVKLGRAEIMVAAEVDSNFKGNCGNIVSGKSDRVVKKTFIKHEGQLVEEVKSGFICGDNSKFDNKTAWNFKIPPEVVESSVMASAFVSGDVFGPPLKNLNHLISLPTGCGEQNMILLVPSIFVLEYLLSSKPDDIESVEKALKNLDLGYQRQLNYKHEDGSYSAFGKQDGRGSIWLTAFVVRYLMQAKKYTFIDDTSLNTSIAWIMKQQLENGCFPMIGKIYHRKFQERLFEEDSTKTLSAYILISLIEAGISKDNPVVRNAIYCLKPTHESLGLYGDLLSAYALILAGEYRDSQALMIELMKEAKRSYGMLWWEDGESLESAIEMTGYGILTLVKLGGPHFLAAAADSVRWIIQYQNQNGGFVSSQDSILALEAVSKFIALLPKSGKEARLTIIARTFGEEYTFNINPANRLLQQHKRLPSFLTNLEFESSGQGCALVQSYLRYNLRRGTPSEDLKIQLRIESVSNVDLHSIAKFHICVRYKSTSERINMAILEVSMISGYYPDRSSLYEIQTSRKGVRRWEEYEDKINFYFDELKNKKVCLHFLVVREACVENADSALIKLYDYYNNQRQASVKYNFTSSCQNTSSLMDVFSPKIKQESKRDLRLYEDLFYRKFQIENNNNDHLHNFVNMEQDLEVPAGINGVLPVYALAPRTEKEAHYCPFCSTKIPEIFPQLYCSAQNALKVMVLSKDAFMFILDVNPRANFTSLKRTVSFTMRENCNCSLLNSVNNYVLLMVIPPRGFDIRTIQEVHVTDSMQLYPWGDPESVPSYLMQAANYCQSLTVDSKF